MVCVAFPISYLLSFVYGFGLNGLWIGYGASAFCLALLYARVITTLDWSKVAQGASTTDESQINETESTQEDDDYKRVQTSTELDDINYNLDDNYKRAYSPLFTQTNFPSEPDSSPFSSL